MRRLFPVIISIVTLLLAVCVSFKIVHRSGTDWAGLDQNNIRQIYISTMPDLFPPFTTDNKDEIFSIVRYFKSLFVSGTKIDLSDFAGAGMTYAVKIKFNDNTERTFYLIGNKLFTESNRFSYEIPYLQAIKFDTIVGNIRLKREMESGGSFVKGTVMSVNPVSSGRNTSCLIEDTDGKFYFFDLDNTIIFDTTGHGNMLLHNYDDVVAFYESVDSSNAIPARSIYTVKTAR